MSNDRETMESQHDELVVYRCTDCGKTSVSIGWLHAHCERHVGWGPFNLLPPPFPGNFDALMEKTEVLRVNSYSATDLEEVEVRG